MMPGHSGNSPCKCVFDKLYFGWSRDSERGSCSNLI